MRKTPHSVQVQILKYIHKYVWCIYGKKYKYNIYNMMFTFVSVGLLNIISMYKQNPACRRSCGCGFRLVSFLAYNIFNTIFQYIKQIFDLIVKESQKTAGK